jgi:hypothetical protein
MLCRLQQQRYGTGCRPRSDADRMPCYGGTETHGAALACVGCAAGKQWQSLQDIAEHAAYPIAISRVGRLTALAVMRRAPSYPAETVDDPDVPGTGNHCRF